MPQCQCGAWVSKAYIRVLAPNDTETLDACLECATKDEVREAVR